MRWIATSVIVFLTTPCLHAGGDAEEGRASSRLKLAQRLHIAGKIETAKDWYADIIKNWPNTEAAQEARRLLAGKTPDSDSDYVSPVAVLDVGPRTRLSPNPVSVSQSTESQTEPTSVPEAGVRANRTASPGMSSSAEQLPLFSAGMPSSVDPSQRRSVGGTISSPLVPLPSSGVVQVRGYWRKNGTYVQPHTRSLPRR